MLLNTKAYLSEILDKHNKAHPKDKAFDFHVTTPVWRYLNLPDDITSTTIMLRKVEFAVYKRPTYKPNIYINDKYVYEFEVPCDFHTFVTFTGLNEVYKYCTICDEKAEV